MKEKNIIEISASLTEVSKDNKIRLLEEIVADVYNNREKLKKAIMECDVNKHDFAYITIDFSKLSKKLIKKYRLNLLTDGTFPLKRCCYCGCYYITYYLYQYRDNCGCVGRSYECISCRNLNNQEAGEIQNISKKMGVKVAKEYQLKLLKDEDGYSLCEEPIIRLDIVDPYSDCKIILDTYYVVNPDEEKLQALKSMVENRYEDEKSGKDNPFTYNYNGVKDYIINNFKTIEIETKEVKW